MHKKRTVTSVVTGKPYILGGSLGRKEATGRGLTIVSLAALQKVGIKPESATAVVQGFGNVGMIGAELLSQQGVKIIAISDISGGIYSSHGFDIRKLSSYYEEHRTLAGFPGSEKITNEELLELQCDLLVPAAKEDQITAKNAPLLKCKIIAEGANGPTTAKADPILQDKGILVIPDILANAGGVTVSYFEWVQDRMGYFWPVEMVNERMDRIMQDAFENVYTTAQRYNVSLRIGAYILAIDKVAKTLKIRGIYA